MGEVETLGVRIKHEETGGSKTKPTEHRMRGYKLQIKIIRL